MPSKTWGRPQSFLQIWENPKKGACHRVWFPAIQERNVLTGHAALVRGEFLLKPGRMCLEFSSALGVCKCVLAWIRVLVLYSKSWGSACVEEQHYSLPLGNNFRVFLGKLFVQAHSVVRV